MRKFKGFRLARLRCVDWDEDKPKVRWGWHRTGTKSFAPFPSRRSAVLAAEIVHPRKMHFCRLASAPGSPGPARTRPKSGHPDDMARAEAYFANYYHSDRCPRYPVGLSPYTASGGAKWHALLKRVFDAGAARGRKRLQRQLAEKERQVWR